MTSFGVFRFESFTVYQRSLQLTQSVYSTTQSWSKEHLFGITDQFRRAVSSISLNIAEGSSRTNKDFRHFLIIARGSCFECIPILHIALGLNLITQKQFDIYYNELEEISRMLSGFRTSLTARS